MFVEFPLPRVSLDPMITSLHSITLLLLCVAHVGTLAQNVPQSFDRRALHESPQSRRTEVTMVEERLRPFYHGVASGDPLSDRVIIWTRVTPQGGDTLIPVAYAVATDTTFTNVVARGVTSASVNRDFTVKVDVDGLQAGTAYYYVFSAYNRSSLIGRTRTLSDGQQAHARLAVVSCANYPAGYFNAYAGIARRNDLDAVLHLGDYIYEYDADSTSYGGATGIALKRQHEPINEIVTLSDYRIRYSQYRLDADLRRLHQQHPMIHVWDDHESANDAYTDGAQNHQPNEGSWSIRKAVSKRVCYEWMPTREQPDSVLYRRFVLGNLVDLFMLDTRLDGRDVQVEGVSSNASQASKDSLNDPTRKIMSEKQFAWLTQGLSSSTSTWRLLGNQVMFTPVEVNPIDTAYLFANIGPIFSLFLRPQLPTLQQTFELGFRGDVWTNYPAQRNRLLESLRNDNVRNLLVATGDFHCAFAFEYPVQTPFAQSTLPVEFITPSISAPNFDETLSTVSAVRSIVPAIIGTIDTTLRGLNQHLKWHDIIHHGYEILDITPERAQCDWFFYDSILVRPSPERWVRSYVTQLNQSKLSSVSTVANGKLQQDVPAPLDPPSTILRVDDTPPSCVTILGYGPVPADHVMSISYVVSAPVMVSYVITDTRGVIVRTSSAALEHGMRSLVVEMTDLTQGMYTITVTSPCGIQHVPLVVRR